MLQTPKRSSDELNSPENHPKDTKIQRKLVRSPLGFGAMISLPTTLPTTMDVDNSITELKDNFGQTLTSDMEKLVRYILEKCNEKIHGCIQTLEYYFECNNKLEESQDRLQSLAEGMVTENANLTSKINALECKIDDQENYSRRNNLIIRGIPEGSYQNTDEIVRSFLLDKFGLYGVQIERLHRLGRFFPNSTRPRPIIVRFVKYADRERIWNYRDSLRNSGFFLDEDFSQPIQAKRRKMLPVMLEARRRGNDSEMEKDKLFVNGRAYSIDTLKNLPKEIRDGSRWGKDQVSFFGELCPASNFHPATFFHEGKTWENSEKALFYKQAMKFGDDETAKLILNETDPRVIKKLSRATRNVNKDEWKASIFDLVTPILVDKFDQNPHLLNWLKSTGTRHLVEAAGPFDTVWGNGLRLSDDFLDDPVTWSGDNKQGRMLMKVRKQLCPELYENSGAQGQPVLPASQGFTTASSAATSSSVVSPPLSSTQGFDPHADPLNENLRVT
jgi:hypothetical protein